MGGKVPLTLKIMEPFYAVSKVFLILKAFVLKWDC